MNDHRETIWGIDPRDRQWFQLLTLIGGAAGSVILTQLEFAHGSATPNEVARNILLGIGASFVASGFIAWGLLQTKELIMAIADWIRASTAKRRERWLQEALQKALPEVRQEVQREVRREVQREAYTQGYVDARAGKPMQPPSDDSGSLPEST